jgi:tryptophan synthase alpha subunit
MLAMNSQNFKEHAGQATRWQAFCEVIGRNRKAKRTTLMPIAIAGYPSRDGYLRFIEVLSEAGIEVIEAVDPIMDGWAPTTNEIIRDAHKLAYAEVRPGDSQLASRFAGSLKVVYPGNISGPSDHYLRQVANEHSILQFAFPPSSPTPYCSSPTTTMVDAALDDTSLEQAVDRADWMVVCKLSLHTGGKQYDPGRVRSALSCIRSRTNKPVFCAFGVSSPADVSALHGLCDGVIIGTSMLRALAKGIDATCSLLTDLQASCGS